MLLHKTLRTNTFKFYSLISNRNNFRNICFRKFSSRNYADGKFQKLASTVGYGVGIAMIFGISNFHIKQRVEVNASELINCKFSYCEASIPFDDMKQLPSLRRSFNFIADVVEKTQNSVVYIEINGRHPFSGALMPISNGSGFIVKEDGLILTNAHVVNHYGQVIVKLYDGTTYHGMVEDIDTESDLALVRIKAANLPALPLGRSSEIRTGEFVIAMGNPLTLSHTITAGVVSSSSRKGKELGLHPKSDYIQTDATIHVGNSGGPLVNLDGEAIGINTMKVTEGISFAIPSDRAIQFIKKSEERTTADNKWFFKKPSGKTKQKFLGISMLTLSPRVAKELKERNPDFASVDRGVLVWRVMIGSPSYEAGIRPGDVITKINQCEVESAHTVMDFLEKEDTLQLTVKRGQKTFKVTVFLVEPVMP